MKENFGPESILLVDYSGSQGPLHGTTGRTARRFFSFFGGCTGTFGNTSQEAALFSSQATFGTLFTGNSRDNFLYSKLIILWGWNPLVTRFGPDTAFYLAQAKKAGAKIICVDPQFNPSGRSLAEQWIRIKPGTDTALLIAMAYVMIAENLHDRRFLGTYTAGFEKLTTKFHPPSAHLTITNSCVNRKLKFCEKWKLDHRTNYESAAKFEILEKRFITSHFAALKWMDFIVNLEPVIYERFLAGIFSSEEVYFKLRVVK